MDHLSHYISLHPLLLLFTVAVATAVAVYETRWRIASRASILPQQVIRLMNDGATVVDLRDAASFATGHISGARNVPGDQIIAGAEALRKLREKQIIVCDDKGVAGAAAVRSLTDQGFSRVFTLRGGLNAWRAEHLPLTRD